MSVSVSLSENRAFGRESLIAIGGGVLSGVVATGLGVIAGATLPQLAALAFGALVGLAANFADDTNSTPMLRLILAIAGGAAMALLWPLNALIAGAAGGVLLGSAFVLGEEHSTVERLGLIGLYGLWMTAAVFVTQTLSGLVESAFIANVFTGATWGTFLAFAGGLRRLEWRRDEVLATFKAAEADLHGELASTVTSGRVLYEQILRELERAPAKDRERASEIASETSQALIALCRRADELQSASERTSERKLQMRVVELDERIAGTDDASVRRELEAALDELLHQVKVRKRLDVARARLEARQQRCFTALERLHVSLIQSGTGGSGDDAAVLESLSSLEKLTDEIRWRNLSVEELCGPADSPDASLEIDDDDLIATIRAGLESKPDVARDVVSNDEPAETPTVLDTAAFADDVDASPEGLSDGPPGTDGNLESESEVHVEHAHTKRPG